MKSIKIIFIIFLFSFTILHNSYASEDRIIAVVNDDIITLSELNTADTRIFKSTSLSFLIEKKLQLQAAKKKGMSVTNSEFEDALNDVKKMNGFSSDDEMRNALLKEGVSFEDYKRELSEQLLILKVINREVKSKISVSDKDVENYYQSHKGNFKVQESIRIGYVNVPLKTLDSEDEERSALRKITSILTDLKNNISLSELKRRYSDSKDINFVNDLGFVKKGDLMPEIENPAFNLKEGEISDVIKTSKGFYIIKKIEVKKTEFKPIDAVKDIIRDAVFQDKSESAYKDWIYNLKTSSYINIYI
ncbi:MAG: peptidyl-prolyl cis-trans isomerase [Nitrospirae bacterium]|nr:peptidyl-prolyl cis-trans isomerase [Nitrospirota bacterium]